MAFNEYFVSFFNDATIRIANIIYIFFRTFQKWIFSKNNLKDQIKITFKDLKDYFIIWKIIFFFKIKIDASMNTKRRIVLRFKDTF